MNERERADMLARTIDELIRGARADIRVEDDDDLRSLIRIARARREAGIESGRQAADHESAIWKLLVARMEAGQPKPDDDDRGHDDMRDVIAARRRVSEDIHELAERHRDEVWRRVQEKVTNQKPRKKGIFSFFQARADGDLPLRRSGWGHTGLVLTGDAETDSMLRVALAANRRAAQHQLRQRMRSDPARQRQPVPEAPARPAYGGFLLRAGAVAGLAAAAILLGPIPVTGLSGSPAAAAARFAANHLGVSETEQAPPAPGDSTTVTGVEITAADAATGAGLSFAAAPELMGLTLSSQRYFESTASFVATYSSDGASISVFEEAAGGSELSVPEGVASTVMVNGMQATYYEGSWSETDGALTWQPEGTQTVVFERDGVRFTVVYSGPAVDGFDLAEAAAAI
jgi:hypothetical protein